VEEIGRGVARPPARSTRDVDPQNVIGGAEMVVTGRLRRLRKHPDRGRITADIGQCQCNFIACSPTNTPPVLREDEPSP
jgi:hypothetical protein